MLTKIVVALSTIFLFMGILGASTTGGIMSESGPVFQWVPGSAAQARETAVGFVKGEVPAVLPTPANATDVILALIFNQETRIKKLEEKCSAK